MPNEYQNFGAFASSHTGLTYESFDAHTMRDLSLFAIREDLDFASLEDVLDRIIRDLPAIKRIFSTPIIRLRDSSEILPVESVRMVNNRTIVHASSHSELWENITDKGLRPRKLMTLQHEDHYAIYENLIFAKLIDTILHFVRENVRALTDILYSNRELRFDLLERVNHLSYYIATAKLHTGYIREYDKHRAPAESCLDKLLFIERIISSRLGSPVYKKCRNKYGKLALKKTNIFRMHKDYHRVYLLMKLLTELDLGAFENDASRISDGDESYSVFCAMMIIFAAGHFNFTFSEGQKLDFRNLFASARFLSWSLTVKREDLNGKCAFRLAFEKERKYEILLLCGDADPEEKNADEIHLLSPYTRDRAVRISLYDIESFRRIQRLLLRGMIMSDSARDICPFCGKALERVKSEESEMHECASCRTQIYSEICAESGKRYVRSAIKNFTPKVLLQRSAATESPVYKRELEALMHFRNITEIDEKCESICPICNKKHVKK